MGQQVSSTADTNRTWHNDSGQSVHDIAYDVTIRISCLYVIIIVGLLGGILVSIWMWFNRRKRSRVNFLILNLTIADLSVVFFGCMTQLIFEYTERRWYAGDAMCRIIKFLQGTSLMSSSYLLVVLAVDRHQAIRSPLKEHWPARYMALVGWVISMALAFPNCFVFHTYESDNITKCENIFRDLPLSSRQAWILYPLTTSFVIPLIILTVCYVRIFSKISEKASESTSGTSTTIRPGKVQLTCNQGSSLPRAKIKTLKMTFVIVSAFIFFGLPYFVAEMIMSFGDYKIMAGWLFGLLGAVAPANSAVNPYVFLLFSANSRCLRGLASCMPCPDTPVNERHKYSVTSGTELSMMNAETTTSRTNTRADKTTCVEMSQLYT